MDHLTKQQLILLAILVAVVTSITTGIVTASLMDQSSEGVTQTVYRIVERTIQEVAPPNSSVVRKIVEKTEPKEPKPLVLDDIVAKAEGSIVKIFEKNKNTGAEKFVSIAGAFKSKNQFLGLSSAEISKSSEIVIEYPGGKRFAGTLVSNGDYGFALYSVTGEVPSISSLVVSGLKNLRLGSSVIAIGAKPDSIVVSTGIASEYALPKNNVSTTTNSSLLITDLKLSSPLSGWLLLNTSGEVVGFIVAGDATDKGARYLDAEILKSSFPTVF